MACKKMDLALSAAAMGYLREARPPRPQCDAGLPTPPGLWCQSSGTAHPRGGRVVLRGEGAMQPGAYEGPVAFGGPQRQVQDLSGLGHAQAGGEAELDQPGRQRVVGLEATQGLVKGLEIPPGLACTRQDSFR